MIGVVTKKINTYKKCLRIHVNTVIIGVTIKKENEKTINQHTLTSAFGLGIGFG